jgi:imidazolonepropionase-like amidohydrolase
VTPGWGRLALGTAIAFAATLAAHAEVKVLRDFRLVDTAAGRVTPGEAMVVEDGRIAWVGPARALKAPPKAEVVDLHGAYVMPGLIDLHAHLAAAEGLKEGHESFTLRNIERDLRQYAAYGVTTVVSLGTDGDLVFDVRARERAGGRPPFSRIYTVGQGLVFKNGYGGVEGINHPVATAAEAVREVDAQADKGADMIKLWVDDEFGAVPKMPPAMQKAIIDEAHRRGLKAVAHVFYLADARRLVDMGLDGFAHMVRDQAVDDALIADMKRHGTWQMAATLSREASMYAFGERPPFMDDPFFRRAVAPRVLAQMESAERRKAITQDPHYQDFLRFRDNAGRNLKRMVAAGVKYGFGTDSGPPGRLPGYFDHWELQEMVGAGLTPAQALTAATRDAAEFLGARDLGQIAPGRWADLLVLRADPLVDIRNTHKIAAVYIAGNRVSSFDD